jgi:ubiquinone/menaquinone biosynthesis C-methylase UbiE
LSRAAIKVGPAEGCSLWAGGYDHALNPLLALEERLLRAEIEGFTGKHVLDVGCGTGRWMTRARDAGAIATGIDLSRSFLAQAAGKPDLRGRLAAGDAAWLPFQDQRFDVVLCSFVMGYLASTIDLLGELARVVKPGGRMITSDLHPAAVEQGWKSSFRVAETVFEIDRRLYRLDDVRAAAARQRLREIQFMEAPIGEPEKHLFVAAGRAEQFERVKDVRAVYVLVWERSCL